MQKSCFNNLIFSQSLHNSHDYKSGTSESYKKAAGAEIVVVAVFLPFNLFSPTYHHITLDIFYPVSGATHEICFERFLRGDPNHSDTSYYIALVGCPSYTCYSILRLVWNFQFKVKTNPEQNQPFNARTQLNFFYDPDDSLPAPPHPPTDYLNFSSCWSRSSYYGDSIHVHPSSLLHCSPCPQWWLEWLPGPKSKVRSLSSISPTISI